jgi:hypothetical protein
MDANVAGDTIVIALPPPMPMPPLLIAVRANGGDAIIVCGAITSLTRPLAGAVPPIHHCMEGSFIRLDHGLAYEIASPSSSSSAAAAAPTDSVAVGTSVGTTASRPRICVNYEYQRTTNNGSTQCTAGMVWYEQ